MRLSPHFLSVCSVSAFVSPPPFVFFFRIVEHLSLDAVFTYDSILDNLYQACCKPSRDTPPSCLHGVASDPRQQSLPHMATVPKRMVHSGNTADSVLEVSLSIGVFMASLPGAIDDGTGTGRTTAGDGKKAYRQPLYAYNNHGYVADIHAPVVLKRSLTSTTRAQL